MIRADKIVTRLRAARLDKTLNAKFRRLTRLELLIVDDFALRPLDATTSDFHELCVGRHDAQHHLHVQPEAGDWTTMTTDPVLAQLAVHRLTAAAHTLIV